MPQEIVDKIWEETILAVMEYEESDWSPGKYLVEYGPPPSQWNKLSNVRLAHPLIATQFHSAFPQFVANNILTFDGHRAYRFRSYYIFFHYAVSIEDHRTRASFGYPTALLQRFPRLRHYRYFPFTSFKRVWLDDHVMNTNLLFLDDVFDMIHVPGEVGRYANKLNTLSGTQLVHWLHTAEVIIQVFVTWEFAHHEVLGSYRRTVEYGTQVEDTFVSALYLVVTVERGRDANI